MLKRASSFVGATVAALLVALSALAVEPIPDFYQEPGINPNRDYVDQHISERIDPFTGKLQIHAVDLFIPGAGGLNIQVQRSYSSVNEDFVEPTAMGMGWTINFGRVLRRGPTTICDNQTVTPTRMPVLELPDGSRQILYLSVDRTYWITINRWRATCSPNGGMDVFAPDGTRYEMTRPGVPAGPASAPQNGWYVSQITDRNGNWLRFQYVDLAFASAVSQITASDGRAVTFTYANNVLSTVSDGNRPPWRYRYVYSNNPAGEGYPFLKEVERPDGRKWGFEYNLVKTQAAGAFSMRRMQYPTGGWFDYDYGLVSFMRACPRPPSCRGRRIATTTSGSSRTRRPRGPAR
jgi:hypothetical protein